MKCLVAVLMLLCGCAHSIDVDSWRRHDLGLFALSLPVEFGYHTEIGEDSYIGRFETKGVRVEFDYGLWSDPLEYDSETDFSRRSLIIDGREAIIAHWKHEGERRHVSAVHFTMARQAEEKLTVYVFSDQVYPFADVIFKSITFSE